MLQSFKSMKRIPDDESIAMPIFPAWAGDLSADCSARWKGLKLTARKSGNQNWSWIVYDMRSFEKMRADSSGNDSPGWTSGDAARKAAEAAARNYLETGRITRQEPKGFDLLLFTISALAFTIFAILIFPVGGTNVTSVGWNIENFIVIGIFYFLLGPALFLLQYVFTGEPGFWTLAFLLLLNSVFYGFLTERIIFFIKKSRRQKN